MPKAGSSVENTDKSTPRRNRRSNCVTSAGAFQQSNKNTKFTPKNQRAGRDFQEQLSLNGVTDGSRKYNKSKAQKLRNNLPENRNKVNNNTGSLPSEKTYLTKENLSKSSGENSSRNTDSAIANKDSLPETVATSSKDTCDEKITNNTKEAEITGPKSWAAVASTQPSKNVNRFWSVVDDKVFNIYVSDSDDEKQPSSLQQLTDDAPENRSKDKGKVIASDQDTDTTLNQSKQDLEISETASKKTWANTISGSLPNKKHASSSTTTTHTSNTSTAVKEHIGCSNTKGRASSTSGEKCTSLIDSDAPKKISKSRDFTRDQIVVKTPKSHAYKKAQEISFRNNKHNSNVGIQQNQRGSNGYSSPDHSDRTNRKNPNHYNAKQRQDFIQHQRGSGRQGLEYPVRENGREPTLVPNQMEGNRKSGREHTTSKRYNNKKSTWPRPPNQDTNEVPNLKRPDNENSQLKSNNDHDVKTKVESNLSWANFNDIPVFEMPDHNKLTNDLPAIVLNTPKEDNESDVEVIMDDDTNPWSKYEMVLGMTTDPAAECPEVVIHFCPDKDDVRFRNEKRCSSSFESSPDYDEKWRLAIMEEKELEYELYGSIGILFPDNNHLSLCEEQLSLSQSSFNMQQAVAYEANGMVYYGVDPNVVNHGSRHLP